MHMCVFGCVIYMFWLHAPIRPVYMPALPWCGMCMYMFDLASGSACQPALCVCQPARMHGCMCVCMHVCIGVYVFM